MFYRFDGKSRTVIGVNGLFDAESSDKSFVAGYLSVTELEELAPRLGLPATTVQQCREEVRYFRNSMEVGEHYSFATVKRTGGSDEGEDCIAFYILPRLFLVVDIRDSDGSIRAGFEGALRRFPAPAAQIERLIFAFLDSMIEGDGRMLEELEFTFSKLEENVLRDVADDDFTIRLLHHKQYLLLLHNYYEQLIDIGESLSENENRLFKKSELRHFRRFTDKAERLCRNVSSLREQLGQLREAYQSMLDLRLNDIMKTFTVLSAIFLPLSLIVGWYGMNFTNMPELHWKFGYPLVTLFCGIVVLICIRIFKKHHWM
ncbi:MAG: hypothetical protein IJX39_00740 [Clostridia bacterium]|nr:hypothetical protein [Clostridia bacterium]